MSYVLVREDKSLLQSYHVRCRYERRGAAERQAQKLEQRGYGKLTVMSTYDYFAAGYADLKRTVYNSQTGEPFEESINTPYCCSPSSEHYFNN